jgi:hypothetical protein
MASTQAFTILGAGVCVAKCWPLWGSGVPVLYPQADAPLHSKPVAVEADQLSRVLGAGWERMGYGQLAGRARSLEQAAGFVRTLARYVVETDARTAGEALTRLQASRLADAEEWRDAAGIVGLTPGAGGETNGLTACAAAGAAPRPIGGETSLPLLPGEEAFPSGIATSAVPAPAARRPARTPRALVTRATDGQGESRCLGFRSAG